MSASEILNMWTGPKYVWDAQNKRVILDSQAKKGIHYPEELVIIGGGLAGVITALMAAQQVDEHGNHLYHVTLLEKGKHLFNGASKIVSREHQGGEYPLHPATAFDCLKGAIADKLLLPDFVFTDVKRMHYRVTKESEREGIRRKGRGKTVTLEKYLNFYERVKEHYKKIVEKAMDGFKWDYEQASAALFGKPEKGVYYGELTPEDYAHAPDIAGGIWTQERGYNLIKYLSTLQYALEKEVAKGNVAIHLEHEVVPSKREGIDGPEFQRKVHCTNGAVFPCSLVNVTVGAGVASLLPLLGDDEIRVYKRAMLFLDLPEVTDPQLKKLLEQPAFDVIGKPGGMFNPYNKHVMVGYRPEDPKASIVKNWKISNNNPQLPPNWNDISEEEKQRRTADYYRLLIEKFPFLKGATNPRLVIEDTNNLDEVLHRRRHKKVYEQQLELNLNEYLNIAIGKHGMTMAQIPAMKLEAIEKQSEEEATRIVEKEMEENGLPILKAPERGIFVNILTKGTNAVLSASHTIYMLNQRNFNPGWEEQVNPPTHNPLNHIMSAKGREKFSLQHMQLPPLEYMQKFAKTVGLPENMVDELAVKKGPSAPSGGTGGYTSDPRNQRGRDGDLSPWL